ncbi:MAG: sensor signal transduction histidine kinase [Ferruginibacter sp.]|nr:sensor signal transduction histidine kinase [Ferruginibacter sp.]
MEQYDALKNLSSLSVEEEEILRLQEYVENAPIGVHWLNADGIIIWANKTELGMLGYEASEYIGHHISSFHTDRDKINNILKRLNHNETLIGYEAVLRCKDGSARVAQISSDVYYQNEKFVHIRSFTVNSTEQKPPLSVLKDATDAELILDENDHIASAVNMLIDIAATNQSKQTFRDGKKELHVLTESLERMVARRTHDLERRNEDLKKSEEKYHKMIEEVEDYAIVLLNEEGIIQNWNKGAENIKGYKEEEIVGKSFKVFYLEDDRKRGFPEKLLALAKEKGKAIHEGWRRRKDGSRFWGSIVITALHDAENNIVGFSKVTRDLTERKAAEDKLMEYSKQLEFQNKELEQFTYASSHDMKEPLRKISFYNNFIAENPAIQLDEKSKEYLRRSISAVKRMSHLIEALIAYSRTNSAIENFEETDLNEIVEEVIVLHKDIIEDKGIQIEVALLPMIQGIPFQLRQLMDNLIVNAIKYKHPERTSIITISSEQVSGKDVKINELDNKANYYKISVADNGIGFDAMHAEKIFEIFQRLNNQLSYEGSGIGLAICKKIVQNHSGFISATAKENEGARFDIYLPISD